MEKFLEDQGITKEGFELKTIEEKATLLKDYQNYVVNEINKLAEDNVSKEAMTTAIESATKGLSFATPEQLKALEDIIDTQGTEIARLKNSKDGVNGGETLAKAIKKAIESNEDAFKTLSNSPSASFNVTTKAAATMLTNTNTTGRVVRHERDDERTKPQRRQPFVLDYVNSTATNARVITYVEREAPDGNPGMTAEGGVKPLIDFDYVERTSEVKKMTAFTKFSKEMMEDVDGFIADTEDELDERLMLLFDEQLLSGDGTGQNLTGIEANATPFAAGNLATSIDEANNFDVLRAAIKQVVVNNFYPTVIFMNPEDVAEMELTKGNDGHYIMPPFTAADGSQIKGLPVVENNGVTVDDFIVGDLSKFKVKVRENLNIDYGYENDDFRKNLISAVCEGRATAYIPNNYFGAIVKGTFTAAKAALETV